jgi:hypothetical protein
LPGAAASGGIGIVGGDSDFAVAAEEEIPLAQAIALPRQKVSSNVKKIFDHRGGRGTEGRQTFVVVSRFMFSL